MDSSQATELLADVQRLRRRTRVARHGYWFPLLVVGLLALGALPLFRYPSLAEQLANNTAHQVGPGSYAINRPAWIRGVTTGGQFLADAAALSLYWLVAIPLGYVATVAFYRYHARRSGVASSSLRPYIATGLALLAALLLLAGGATGLIIVPGDLVVRGLAPLLTVPLALLMLARIERSWGLAAVAGGVGLVALVANLYNIENLFYRVGLTAPSPQINLIVLGGALLAAGAGCWLVTWRARRRLL
jgi:hypothetical protein